MGKTLEQTLHKKDNKIANEQMKECSILLIVIRKM